MLARSQNVWYAWKKKLDFFLETLFYLDVETVDVVWGEHDVVWLDVQVDNPLAVHEIYSEIGGVELDLFFTFYLER